MKLFTKLNENKVIMITESQAMDLLLEAATIQDISEILFEHPTGYFPTDYIC